MRPTHASVAPAGLTALLPSATARSTPTSVPYTGYLTSADGQPFQGDVSVVVALYAAQSGDALRWGPTHLGTVCSKKSVNAGCANVTCGTAASGNSYSRRIQKPSVIWHHIARQP